MSLETQPISYKERVATVVGGRGQLGRRIVEGLEGLGFREVRICGKEDPLTKFVESSTDLFFAVDAEQIKIMLQATRDLLRQDQSILDGASVKSPLISLYRKLDGYGISVCSTHLGAVPTQPWRGVKVWICEVGKNSEKAKKLAVDLFLAKNTSIQLIDIKDHERVEQDQWFTIAIMHIFVAALRRYGLPLEKFNAFATLNAELATLPLGRTLGQGTRVPSEILFGQPKRHEFFAEIQEALRELGQNLDSREGLQRFMQKNIGFHDDPVGVVSSIFRKAGTVGARNANLRMYTLSLRITDDEPGKLIELLNPFYKEGVNLTAIDSIPGAITPEEEQQGVDPDRIVDFDIGIDPKTIDPKKAERIKARLREIGCIVGSRQVI